MIVGSFNQLTRVDNDFIRSLVRKTAEKPDAKEIIAGFWGFSEIVDWQGEKHSTNQSYDGSNQEFNKTSVHRSTSQPDNMINP